MGIFWTVVSLLVLLSGCHGMETADKALELRSKSLSADGCTFSVEITANYIDSLEQFTLDCQVDVGGMLTFQVVEPESIEGISGTVSGQSGALTFDDKILAFPLLASDRLSPVSGPWIVLNALRQGNLRAYVMEEELLHLTVDDRYGEDPLTVELWFRGDVLEEAEIAWQGRRAVCLEFDGFQFGNRSIE